MRGVWNWKTRQRHCRYNLRRWVMMESCGISELSSLSSATTSSACSFYFSFYFCSWKELAFSHCPPCVPLLCTHMFSTWSSMNNPRLPTFTLSVKLELTWAIQLPLYLSPATDILISVVGTFHSISCKYQTRHFWYAHFMPDTAASFN